jgi:NADPH:quinone reductase
MSQAIIIEQTGGPEQMKLVEREVGEPGAGEIRIRHHAIGLNFIDVYQRSVGWKLLAWWKLLERA